MTTEIMLTPRTLFSKLKCLFVDSGALSAHFVLAGLFERVSYIHQFSAKTNKTGLTVRMGNSSGIHIAK
jgi:hypothetical protein